MIKTSQYMKIEFDCLPGDLVSDCMRPVEGGIRDVGIVLEACKTIMDFVHVVWSNGTVSREQAFYLMKVAR